MLSAKTTKAKTRIISITTAIAIAITAFGIWQIPIFKASAADATAVWNSETPPDISSWSGENNTITISDEISGELIVPDDTTVTIAGTAVKTKGLSVAATGITINIGNGAKVIWEADFSGTAGPLIRALGYGTLEVTDGEINNHHGDGKAIDTVNTDVTVTVSGGTIRAGWMAINSSQNVAVSGSAEIVAWSYASAAITTTENVTVSDSALIATYSHESMTIVAIQGTVTVSDSVKIIATGSASDAIAAQNVTVNGGVVLGKRTSLIGELSGNTIVSGGVIVVPDASNLTISGDSVVIAWTDTSPYWTSSYSYSDETTTDLLSNPADSAYWDYTAQGIKNSKNSIVIEIDNVSVTCNHKNLPTNWTEITAPTCEVDGVEAKECPDCDYEETQSIPNSALGHDLPNVWTERTPPTCNIDGEEFRHCSRYSDCNHEETRPITALTHTWVTNGDGTHSCTTTGGCGEEDEACDPVGSYGDECDKCGYATPNPACDHDDTTTTQSPAPTCTAGGASVETCDGCNGTLSANPLNALGHDFQIYTPNNDATCTTNGTETADCERCDETDTRTVANSALGHSFGEWVITTPATATKAGLKTKTCTICSSTETEIIPATGNNNNNDSNGGGSDNNSGNNNSAAVRDAIISGGGIGGGSGAGGGGTKPEPNSRFENQSDSFTKGSSEALTLTIDKNFADFQEVRRNGRRLTRGTHYTAQSGSTIITLLPEYLDTLDEGEHELSIHFSGLVTVNTSFTIANAEYDDVSTLAGILEDFDSIDN
ncbi:MAG: hypothetical protein FWG90_05590 [Oscillospiraceae bacterium]|nr:hypothetical protein [Oscillospiraceae bacterium]